MAACSALRDLRKCSEVASLTWKLLPSFWVKILCPREDLSIALHHSSGDIKIRLLVKSVRLLALPLELSRAHTVCRRIPEL